MGRGRQEPASRNTGAARCTLLLANQAHPQYRLVLAANRDEFYDRPTAAASFWEDAPQVFGGRDLVHGGTWLAVTTTGRIAALTNYREAQEARKDGPSRGELVSEFVKGDATPDAYLARLRAKASFYNGYNLIVGDADRLLYYSNRSDRVTVVNAGFHGVSNHLLDTPWPKVVRGKAALARVLDGGAVAPQSLFDILADTTKAPDAELPDTGVGLEWERLLSSIFITSERYGTRSSSVLLVDRDLRAIFIERNFDGKEVRDRRTEFAW
ncbi:MAG TPA: NRDE family protein [Geomonas sp.]|nr:NRDE family protein [Geomonas sp.]